MKKVSFRVRNFDKEQYLTFNIDNDASLDEDLLDFLEDEDPRGIVSVIFEEGEEFDTFSYNITDKIHLIDLSNQEINAEMVLKVFHSLVLTLIDMAEYRIPLSYLVLNRNYIYVDSDYRIEFICIPVEEMKEETDINMFLRNLIASLRFDPSENGDYVAKLITYINDYESFNLRNMVAFIEDLMNTMGVEIPVNDSAEIYSDYKEAVEEPEPEEEAVEESEPEEEPVEEPEPVKEPEEAVEETVYEPEPEEEAVEEPVEEPEPEEEAVEESEPEEEPVEEPEPVKEPEPDPGFSFADDLPEQEEPADVEEPEEVIYDADESEYSVEDIEEPRYEPREPEEVPEEAAEEEPEPDSPKKTKFKTKDTSVTGVVIEDDFEDFLAEKEMEEKRVKKEDSGLKIKKGIKVNRADMVKKSKEEAKAEELERALEAGIDIEAEKEKEENAQPANTAAPLPKVNPYLIRVNTDERIMINKATFKLGKASMGIDYSIQGNAAISRVHAIITNKDDKYFIQDNKSTNHTFVDGKIIPDDESVELSDNCKIKLGDEEFIFKVN